MEATARIDLLAFPALPDMWRLRVSLAIGRIAFPGLVAPTFIKRSN